MLYKFQQKKKWESDVGEMIQLYLLFPHRRFRVMGVLLQEGVAK